MGDTKHAPTPWRTEEGHKRTLILSIIDLVVVDYIQIIEPDAGMKSREQQVSAIAHGLKRMALDLGVPVLTGSQFSKEGEKRRAIGVPARDVRPPCECGDPAAVYHADNGNGRCLRSGCKCDRYHPAREAVSR